MDGAADSELRGKRDVRKKEGFHHTGNPLYLRVCFPHCKKCACVMLRDGRRSAGLENILQQTFVPRMMR